MHCFAYLYVYSSEFLAFKLVLMRLITLEEILQNLASKKLVCLIHMTVKTQSTCFYFLAWFLSQPFNKAFRPKTLTNIAHETHTMCTPGLNALSSLLFNTLLQ